MIPVNLQRPFPISFILNDSHHSFRRFRLQPWEHPYIKPSYDDITIKWRDFNNLFSRNGQKTNHYIIRPFHTEVVCHGGIYLNFETKTNEVDLGTVLRPGSPDMSMQGAWRIMRDTKFTDVQSLRQFDYSLPSTWPLDLTRLQFTKHAEYKCKEEWH
jgi:hypothetical protein